MFNLALVATALVFITYFLLSKKGVAYAKPMIPLIARSTRSLIEPGLEQAQSLLVTFDNLVGSLPTDVPDSPIQCFEISHQQGQYWLALALRGGAIELRVQHVVAGQSVFSVVADNFSRPVSQPRIVPAVDTQIDRALSQAAAAQGMRLQRIY